MPDVYVQIIERKTRLLVKEMGPMNSRRADRVEGGVNINMNHDDYYTRVVGEDERDEDIVRETERRTR